MGGGLGCEIRWKCCFMCPARLLFWDVDVVMFVCVVCVVYLLGWLIVPCCVYWLI